MAGIMHVSCLLLSLLCLVESRLGGPDAGPQRTEDEQVEQVEQVEQIEQIEQMEQMEQPGPMDMNTTSSVELLANMSNAENLTSLVASQAGDIGWFAEVCRATYCDVQAPLENVERFQGGSSLALVGNSGGKCVVAFRGTSNLGGAALDAQSLIMVPLQGCPGCLVGSGFLQGYNSLAGQVKGALESRGCKNVIVTGHSLGAAEAMIAMYDLGKAGYHLETTYTFGSPRLGNAAFNSALDGVLHGAQIFRVVHGADPVVGAGPPGSSHWGTQIYESGANVLTDHLFYAGVYLTPCIGSLVAKGVGEILP